MEDVVSSAPYGSLNAAEITSQINSLKTHWIKLDTWLQDAVSKYRAPGADDPNAKLRKELVDHFSKKTKEIADLATRFSASWNDFVRENATQWTEPKAMYAIAAALIPVTENLPNAIESLHTRLRRASQTSGGEFTNQDLVYHELKHHMDFDSFKEMGGSDDFLAGVLKFDGKVYVYRSAAERVRERSLRFLSTRTYIDKDDRVHLAKLVDHTVAAIACLRNPLRSVIRGASIYPPPGEAFDEIDPMLADILLSSMDLHATINDSFPSDQAFTQLGSALRDETIANNLFADCRKVVQDAHKVLAESRSANVASRLEYMPADKDGLTVEAYQGSEPEDDSSLYEWDDWDTYMSEIHTLAREVKRVLRPVEILVKLNDTRRS